MKKMKRSMVLLSGLLIAAITGAARAGDMIPDAAGKIGEFSTKLKGYSAEATHDSIAKRMSQKGYSKHDLSTATADIYVPKTPGKDNKYGLIVAQNFREYGKPPTAWEDVLDKYHLIWIGFEGVTDGMPALMRVGFTLDAVYNAENTWAIDMNRVYVFNCSMEHPGAEVGLYYPDVFTGSINSTQHSWFHGVPNSEQKDAPRVFPTIPKTDAATTELGKTRRFVLIDRSENGVTGLDNDIATFGYIKDGYKDAKILSVKTNIGQKYMDCRPEWFELALGYIDTGAKTPSTPLTAAAEEVAAASEPPPSRMSRQAPTTAAAANAKPAAPATKPAPEVMQVPIVSDADIAEEKATKALNLAKAYWAAGQNGIAKPRLQKIIQEFPKTAAARDAKALLDQINAQP
jgi:hypothetical protein